MTDPSITWPESATAIAARIADLFFSPTSTPYAALRHLIVDALVADRQHAETFVRERTALIGDEMVRPDFPVVYEDE